jgi:hypothetical protein
LICARPLRSIGFLRSHRALAVSDGCRGLFSSDTVRHLVAQVVSSSRRLSASSEYVRPGSAPIRADIQAGSRRVHLPWSSRALMTTSVCRIVTATGLPSPMTFRPWRSSRLRRFHPRPTLRVYFTPQPPSGFTLQGISLPHSHDDSSPPHSCLLVGSPTQAVCSCPHTPLEPEPPSRLSSVRKSVVKRTGVSRQLARSLPEFPLLQVLLSPPAPQKFYPLLPHIALSGICRVIPPTGVLRFEN